MLASRNLTWQGHTATHWHPIADLPRCPQND
jgi:hypothetical protein